MTTFRNLITAAMAASTFAITPPAFAQDADTDAKVDTKADTKVDTKADTKDKDKTEAKSPFYFSTLTGAGSDLQFFVIFVAQGGAAWSKGVGGTINRALDQIKDPAQREKAAWYLERIPEGARNIFFYIAKDPMDTKVYITWLKDRHSCISEGKNKFGIEISSDECKDAFKEIADKVKKAVEASEADATTKGNVLHTVSEAERLIKGDVRTSEGKAVKAHVAIAMLHLAALMLPFEELVKLYGLVNDLNLLNGKYVSAKKHDGDTVSGIVEKFEIDGVTIKGEEKIPHSDIKVLSFCDNEEDCKDLGEGGGYPVDGLGVSAEVGVDRIATPSGMTDAHAMYAGARLLYHFEIPLAVFAAAGVYSVFDGGDSDWATESSGKRTAGYLSGGLVIDPRLSDTWGIEITAQGYGLTSGGGGGALTVAPKAHFGSKKQFSLSLGPRVGGVHYGENVSTNPTTPRLDDPILEGFTIGGVGQFTWTFVPHSD